MLSVIFLKNHLRKLILFFKVAQRIREQQVYIKQKIQLATENRAFYYYNQIYNNAVIESPTQSIKSIVERFNDANIPPYIQKELALGLEKTFEVVKT